jgi:hypothetical protein
MENGVRAGLLWKGRREGGGLDDAMTREGLEAAAPCVTVGAGGIQHYAQTARAQGS